MHLRSVGPSDRHPPVATRRPGGRHPTRAGAIIATITAVAPESQLGPVRQTYASAETFPPIARAYTEVSQVVRETGLLARTPWLLRHRRRRSSLLALGGAITGFILLGDTWFQLLIAGALGIILTQVAFLVARGRAPTDPRRRDPRTTASAASSPPASSGISHSWWNNKHTRHHANPNRVGKDPDIEVDTISFLEEDAAKARRLRALITRKPGLAVLPAAHARGPEPAHLGIKHLLRAARSRAAGSSCRSSPLRFALYLTPLFLFLPIGMAFAFLGVQLAVFGVYMGASFAPNHKGMPIIAADAKLDFFSKQVRTSRNIRGGWWATSLMGGLNYQVEHHLFPSMPRPHLAKAREIVMEQCAHASACRTPRPA